MGWFYLETEVGTSSDIEKAKKWFIVVRNGAGDAKGRSSALDRIAYDERDFSMPCAGSSRLRSWSCHGPSIVSAS
jgi:hypothetical protein